LIIDLKRLKYAVKIVTCVPFEMSSFSILVSVSVVDPVRVVGCCGVGNVVLFVSLMILVDVVLVHDALLPMQ